MIYYLLFLSLLVLCVYISIKILIVTKTQKDKACRVCNSNSYDCERVSRNNLIKKIFLAKDVHKYWCRKCGNNFYHKNTNY